MLINIFICLNQLFFLMDEEDKEEERKLSAKEILEQKFGTASRTGGKGTERRKKKFVSKANKNEDKKLTSILKKYWIQNLPEIEEVNFFKDDDTVIHFVKPDVQFAIKEKLLVVSGPNEVKPIKDLMPGILKQVGPQQFETLKKLAETMKEAKNEEKKLDDDIPALSGTFEDASKLE